MDFFFWAGLTFELAVCLVGVEVSVDMMEVFSVLVSIVVSVNGMMIGIFRFIKVVIL